MFETGISGISFSSLPEQSTSLPLSVHLHVGGHDFDPSVKQMEKMKMKTTGLVSIVPFGLHAASLGVVAIQTKKMKARKSGLIKIHFAIHNKYFAVRCNSLN